MKLSLVMVRALKTEAEHLARQNLFSWAVLILPVVRRATSQSWWFIPTEMT